MTITQLLKACTEQVKKGNGNKEIWISDDDEGNGYHCLFYEFCEDVESLDMNGQFKQGDNKTKIILG